MTPIRGFFAFVASLILAIGIYSMWPEYNPLAKYGVIISKEGNESPSLDTFEIHLKGRKYPSPDNPGVTGEHLVIEFRDLDGDGVEEILVRAESSKDSRTVIKVLVEHGKAVGFHILETHLMCLGFSKEGYYCP